MQTSKDQSATSRKSWIAGLCALSCVLAAPAVMAQQYPTKPIRLLVGFAGGSDLTARFVAQLMSPGLGQQVVVEPRLGVAGSIAFEAAAKSAPDGYTLLMGAVPLLTNPLLYAKAHYDPVKDFTPVTLLQTIPNMLFLHPTVPAKTLKDLIALARKAPGKIAYGSGGVGSANHIAVEFLQSLAKVKFQHVPYKTASAGFIGAMSGDVDMVVSVVPSGASYVKEGRMRGIVVMDTKRSVSLPDVPTSAEAGMPELIAVNWYALMAPAGTPKAIIDRLNAEAVKAMAPAEVQSKMRALGGDPETTTPEKTQEFLRNEYAKWSKVIRAAGIKPE